MLHAMHCRVGYNLSSKFPRLHAKSLRCTTFLPHQQPAGSRPQRLRRCECHTLHQGRKINDVATNTRIDFRRHLSGLAGEAEESSVSRSGRTYLEHWAGIRGGRGGSRSDSSGSDPPRGATPRERGQEQHRQQQQPITTFFGRTYLVPTIRMPPFPPQPSAARHGGSAGTKADRAGRKAAGAEEGGLEDEDERVFEWMSGMLLQGNGGVAGTSGILPAAGSPVVLDLGAVSQDGSPHGRPAGRASLSGATRAVKAAGFVPVGVCNTSHDVLKLAAEQGLPEFMMVQARPRAPPSPTNRHTPTITTTAADVRASNRKRLREIASSVPREQEIGRASGPEASPVTEDASPSDGSTLPKARPSAMAPPKLEEPSPAVAVDVADTAAPLTSPLKSRVNAVGGDVDGDGDGDDDSQNVRGFDVSLSGGTEDVDEGMEIPEVEEEEEEEEEAGVVGGERSRETMVYQGSVRSGQQVYADGTSLVVIGAVSSGGEVMADGDIHVYGTLRGRALAGLSGNTSAKIFSTRFDAELVGVADTFTTCHDPDSLPGLVAESPTNVSLSEGRLVFRSFDIPTPSTSSN